MGSDKASTPGAPLGCVLILVVVNLLSMGAIATSFSQGPYSSLQQEIWYRYVALGFFILGAVLPTVTLLLFRRRQEWFGTLVIWMLSALLFFGIYLFNSGGGI